MSWSQRRVGPWAHAGGRAGQGRTSTAHTATHGTHPSPRPGKPQTQSSSKPPSRQVLLRPHSCILLHPEASGASTGGAIWGRGWALCGTPTRQAAALQADRAQWLAPRTLICQRVYLASGQQVRRTPTPPAPAPRIAQDQECGMEPLGHHGLLAVVRSPST